MFGRCRRGAVPSITDIYSLGQPISRTCFTAKQATVYKRSIWRNLNKMAVQVKTYYRSSLTKTAGFLMIQSSLYKRLYQEATLCTFVLRNNSDSFLPWCPLSPPGCSAAAVSAASVAWQKNTMQLKFKYGIKNTYFLMIMRST